VRHPSVDISSELQVHSLRAGEEAPCCSSCLRRPLPGEVVHFYDAERVLCTLCRADLPEDRRTPLRSERVFATRHPLSVIPRAA
jgi:hypothetical protein